MTLVQNRIEGLCTTLTGFTWSNINLLTASFASIYRPKSKPVTLQLDYIFLDRTG